MLLGREARDKAAPPSVHATATHKEELRSPNGSGGGGETLRGSADSRVIGGVQVVG